MITLHFHLIPQYKYELFHIYFTKKLSLTFYAFVFVYMIAVCDCHVPHLVHRLLWQHYSKIHCQ